MKTSTKLFFYFILFLVAILIRKNLPNLPIWDADSAGYINGAISFLNGSGFKVLYSRSFIYSATILPFVWFSKSIAIVVILQKISGLLSVFLMALIWEKLSSNFLHKKISFFIGFVLIFFFSISTSTLYYELSLRPEAFFVLFSLTLTYLLLLVFDKTNSEGKTLILIKVVLFLNFFIMHLMPRWGFAFFFVIGVVVWKIFTLEISLRKKLVSILAVIILYLVLVFIPESYLKKTSFTTSNSEFFHAQFFYANAFVIEKDVTKIFPDKSVQKVANEELKRAKAEFAILGYNPDILMYGKLQNYVQTVFFKSKLEEETNFYLKKNIELIGSHPILYSQKVTKQLWIFFSQINPSTSLSNATLNLEESYHISSHFVVDFSKYYLNSSNYLMLNEYNSTAYFNVKYNLHELNQTINLVPYSLVLLLYCLAVIGITYILGIFILKRSTKYYSFALIFGLYFFQLITIAFIHTFDNNRYCESIKQFWVLIYAFSLCIILNSNPFKKIIVLFKIFTDFIKPFALLILLFVLIFDSIKLLYYKNQYHIFEPFLQAWPNKYILPEKKDSNEIRILCLGGSTTANLTLSDSCRYPFLLQKKLQSLYPNKKIVVLNLGMDWFSTKHLLINYTTEAKYYQPDIVICMEAINDLYRSFTPRGCSTGCYDDQYTHFYGPSINGANPTTFEYYLLSKSIFGDIPGSFINQVNVKYPLNEFKSIKPYVSNLSALANYVQADSALFILVTQPNIYKSTMIDEELQHCWFNTGFCNRRVAWNKIEYPDVTSMRLAMDTFLNEERRLAFSKKIELIDAEKQMPKDLKYFIDDVHYTNKGADTLSSIIFKAVNKLIK